MGAIPKVKMRQKTQTRQVYNEELGRYEWKEVETDKYVFDETDKIAIAREYHERRCPASDIVSKYHMLHRQKRSHSGLSPSNEKQGDNQIRPVVNKNR